MISLKGAVCECFRNPLTNFENESKHNRMNSKPSFELFNGSNLSMCLFSKRLTLQDDIFSPCVDNDRKN